MVADSTGWQESQSGTGRAAASAEWDAGTGQGHAKDGPKRGGPRRLMSSALRLVDLQYRIWLVQAKMTLRRMVLYVALFGAACLLGLLAIIFLYIGVFHVLTDVAHLRPVWAYLIYGVGHLILAAVLILVATKILGKKDDDGDEEAEMKKPATQEAAR